MLVFKPNPNPFRTPNSDDSSVQPIFDSSSFYDWDLHWELETKESE